MIEWLVDNHDLSRDQAYALCGAVANLHISEIVDAPNWIVSAQMPLCIFKSELNYEPLKMTEFIQ